MQISLITYGIRFLFYWVIDAWLTIWPISNKQDSIALLRIDAIGDFVIWLDSAKEYRRLYTGQRIILIANSAWSDWAAGFPYWDEVWSFDSRRFERNLAYRIQTLLKVRRAGFQIIIQPTYSRTFHGDSLVKASAAVQRIGSLGDKSNISESARLISNRWYTQLIPANTQQLMELDRNAEFVRHLMKGSYEAAMPRLPDELLITKIRPWPNKYIVLFPGAAWQGRRWPLKNFAEVAKRLHNELGWPFVLCGGKSDMKLSEMLGDELTVPFLNWTGKTNLNELAGLIHHAQLLVSNETSAVHIAASVGTPTVCILGGGHHGRFMPYPSNLTGLKLLAAEHKMPCFNCNWKCSQPHEKGSPVPCIENVSIQRVVDLALSLV